MASPARSVSPFFTCTRALDRAVQDAGLVEAGHGAFEIADGCFGLGGVAAAELGLDQADVVFRVAEVGILTLAHDLGEHLFGGFVVAGFDGEFAEPAQAPDAVGRQGGGVGEDAACGFEFAGCFAGAREPVVGVHVELVLADQGLQHVFGLGVAALHVQRFGQPEAGPGNAAGLEDALVKLLRFVGIDRWRRGARPAGA
jgi:hypothetical protein